MHLNKPATLALYAVLLAFLAASLTVISVVPTLHQLGIAYVPAAPIAGVLIYALMIAIVALAPRDENKDRRR